MTTKDNRMEKIKLQILSVENPLKLSAYNPLNLMIVEF